jgi:hypothetical protein
MQIKEELTPDKSLCAFNLVVIKNSIREKAKDSDIHSKKDQMEAQTQLRVRPALTPTGHASKKAARLL